jgi:FtsP/CotA-like multicopper oxidase with cupredoxin domain
MNLQIFRNSKRLFLALVAVALAATPSLAVDYYLCAQSVDKAMPDGALVAMWGFALDNDANLANGCPAGTATVPGPKLIVPSSDNQLVIHLRNDLSAPGNEPVSVVIPGQAMPTDAGGNLLQAVFFTDANGLSRVMSFTQEAATGGGTRTYYWNDIQPGTYAYQSGTHPQVQVQMGLYGALVKNDDDATAAAYPGVTYDDQRDLFFSEVDPVLHAAVAAGTFTGSTLNYYPKYFLLHSYDETAGAWTDVTIDAGNLPPTCIDSGLAVGDTILLRMYNMGLRELAPMIMGAHFDLVAEGGKKYPFARTQYQTLLMPGSTKDALFTPTYAGDYKLVERRLNITDPGVNGSVSGGMQTCLSVAAVGATCAYDLEPVPGDGDVDGLDFNAMLAKLTGDPAGYAATIAAFTLEFGRTDCPL